MLSHAVTEEQRTREERSGTARNPYRQSTICPVIAALTDKAGAGKTFVAISLVCKDIKKKQGVP
jgi:hypothetical protein